MAEHQRQQRREGDELRPVANLIVKLEGRRDRSTANVFDGSKTQTVVVAGVAATF